MLNGQNFAIKNHSKSANIYNWVINKQFVVTNMPYPDLQSC